MNTGSTLFLGEKSSLFAWWVIYRCLHTHTYICIQRRTKLYTSHPHYVFFFMKYVFPLPPLSLSISLWSKSSKEPKSNDLTLTAKIFFIFRKTRRINLSATKVNLLLHQSTRILGSGIQTLTVGFSRVYLHFSAVIDNIRYYGILNFNLRSRKSTFRMNLLLRQAEHVQF